MQPTPAQFIPDSAIGLPRIPAHRRQLMTGRIDDVPDWMRRGDLALPIVKKPFLRVELLQVVNDAMVLRKSA